MKYIIITNNPLVKEKYVDKEVEFYDKKYQEILQIVKNKIALGHNEDDVLETFLLNLFYTGSIGTFAPVSYMDRTKITLIRPLIYTSEKETKRFVRKNNLEIMAKVCPMDRNV